MYLSGKDILMAQVSMTWMFNIKWSLLELVGLFKTVRSDLYMSIFHLESLWAVSEIQWTKVDISSKKCSSNPPHRFKQHWTLSIWWEFYSKWFHANCMVLWNYGSFCKWILAIQQLDTVYFTNLKKPLELPEHTHQRINFRYDYGIWINIILPI